MSCFNGSPPGVGSTPHAVKVKSLGTYSVTIPSSWHDLVQRLQREVEDSDLPHSWEIPVLVDSLEEFAMTHLPDPVYVQPNAPFRFGLRLDGYGKRIPAQSVIRVMLETNAGQARSAEMFMRGFA